MPSFKSKIFNALIRNRYLFKFKLKKPIFDENTSIDHFRQECEEGAAKYGKIPESVSILKEQYEHIPAELISPKNSDEHKIILYVHGGGYVSGSCSDHRGFVSRFAEKTGYKTLQYEYRLAPEHQFPAALDDSILVYKGLLKKYKPENILIAGESAGGGLTLCILLAIKELTLPMPKAAVAISPWTDLKCTSASYKTKNRVSAAPLNSWTVFGNHYIGKNDPENPLISPLYGDLSNLPPLFINSGTDDELFDDGQSFYLKAKKAGVDVFFREGKKMLHCYPLLDPFFPEATEAMNEIVLFIKKHLN